MSFFLRQFALVCFLLFCLSCDRLPGFEEQAPESGHLPWQLDSIPVILAGRILSNAEIGRPHHPKSNEYAPLQQLYRVTVKLENLLKGHVHGNEIAVYYFGYFGPVGGPPRLGMRNNGGRWHVGDRILLFLRSESGDLRTVCDFRDLCAIRVFSGAHPGFVPDLQKPLANAIVDLLLTRGQGAGDGRMIAAILSKDPYVFSNSYAMEKLKQIEKNESPAVRQAAICKEQETVDRLCQISVPMEYR